MGSLVKAIGGGSKKAAKAQVRYSQIANDKLKQASAANLESLQPLADTGIGGLNKLAMYLGVPGTESDESANSLYGSLLKPFTGEDLASTPGYQFGLEQGQMGLDRKAAAAGNYLSGAALKGAARFGQDYAGTKFQEGYNRDALDKSRIQDFLGSVANMGVNTTNNMANIRTGTANNVAENIKGMGNATAAGIIGQQNAWADVADQGSQLALMAATGGMGGMGGLGAGAMGSGAMNSLGGAASQGAMQGFSQNMLNPNFAQNYMGKF